MPGFKLINLILLLSTEMGDASFPGIVDWLDHYKANYYILNGEDVFKGVENFNYVLNDNKNFIKFESFDIQTVNVVYSRRWFQQKIDDIIPMKGIKFENSFENLLRSEFYSFSQSIINQLKDAYWLPSKNRTAVNKLVVLGEASKIGFKIPDTLVTSRKHQLKKFYNKHSGKIISKAIDNFSPLVINESHALQPMYTRLIEESFIESLNETFFPSLFQECIFKDEEYRVFFFENKIFPTAIFSQESSETVLDSRQFSKPENSPRMMPITLPEKINSMIRELMKNVDLNIGSLDIIRNGESYYFLEINPVGQFEAYSRYCNYQLQEQIVKHMINIDERRN